MLRRDKQGVAVDGSRRLNKTIRIAAVTTMGGLVIVGVINWPGFRDKRLLQAADAGDTRAVKLWLGLGADMRAQLYPGVTPLMCAARHAHTETARILLDHGADANFTENIWGVTPLMYAVESGDPGIVQLFLERGADPTPRDEHRKTALIYANEASERDIAHLLRQAGAVE